MPIIAGQCEGNPEEAADLIARLDADNARLRLALSEMIEISQRNSEAELMLIAIRKCAEHALNR